MYSLFFGCNANIHAHRNQNKNVTDKLYINSQNNLFTPFFKKKRMIEIKKNLL